MSDPSTNATTFHAASRGCADGRHVRDERVDSRVAELETSTDGAVVQELHTMFDFLTSLGCARVTFWSDAASGLRAVLAVDDTTLGPAVGGIRTRAYPSLAAAAEDAARLARAMTMKTALGGVDAGGAKIVVVDHPGFDRAAGFARLGQLVAELRGMVRTAGDLGTTAADLAAAARHCEYVNTSHEDLGAATGRSLLRCVEACAAVAGKPGVRGLRVAIQGCGAIGGAAARALAAAGAELVIADLDAELAALVARETGAKVVPPEGVLCEDVDVVCPCAVGGVVTVELADRVAAWAVCGAANNVLADSAAEVRLRERGILFVPDVLASAGAVVHGVSRLMGVADSGALIDALGATAREILLVSRESGRLATEIAHERARDRIRQARETRERAGLASPPDAADHASGEASTRSM
jgi:leucine dehydrogenase